MRQVEDTQQQDDPEAAVDVEAANQSQSDDDDVTE
jgi:hypothetical protein